jgi:Spy/CpxP family protein refolding chaperone
LLVSISSFSQDQTQLEKKSNKGKREKMSPDQRKQVVLDKMTTELNLTAQQQEQIKALIAEQTTKNQAMKAEIMGGDSKKMTNEQREAFKGKRKEEKKAMETKLKTILSPEQFKKMKANEEANREKMREARENREERDDRGGRNDGQED